MPPFERQGFPRMIEDPEIRLPGDNSETNASYFLNQSFINQRVLLRNLPIKAVTDLMKTAIQNDDLRFMAAASMDILAHRYEDSQPVPLTKFLGRCLSDAQLPEVLKMRVPAYFGHRIPKLKNDIDQLKTRYQYKIEKARTEFPKDLDQQAEIVALELLYGEQTNTPSRSSGQSITVDSPFIQRGLVQPVNQPGIRFWNQLVLSAGKGDNIETLEKYWDILIKMAEMDPLTTVHIINEWISMAGKEFHADLVEREKTPYKIFRVLPPTLKAMDDPVTSERMEHKLASFFNVSRSYEPIYYSNLVTDTVKALPDAQAAHIVRSIHVAEDLPEPPNSADFIQVLKGGVNPIIGWFAYPYPPSSDQAGIKYLGCQYFDTGNKPHILMAKVNDPEGKRFPNVINEFGERRSADYLESYFYSRYKDYEHPKPVDLESILGSSDPLTESDYPVIAHALVDMEKKLADSEELSDAELLQIVRLVDRIRVNGEFFITMPLIVGIYHIAPSNIITDEENNNLVRLVSESLENEPWLNYQMLTDLRHITGYHLHSDGLARLKKASKGMYEYSIGTFDIIDTSQASASTQSLLFFQYDFYANQFVQASQVWQTLSNKNDAFVQDHLAHGLWLVKRKQFLETKLLERNGSLTIIEPIITDWDNLSQTSRNAFLDNCRSEDSSTTIHLRQVTAGLADSQYLNFITDQFIPWASQQEDAVTIFRNAFLSDYDSMSRYSAFDEKRRVNRNEITRRIIGSFIQHWPDLTPEVREYFINGLTQNNGFLRSHWSQIARNIGEPHNLSFVIDDLIPWIASQPNANILLGGLFTTKLYKPVSPEAGQITRSDSEIAREIWRAIFLNWDNFDYHRENIYSNAIENEGYLNRHLLNFSQNLDSNYDLVVQYLIPLAVKDENAGAVLHFILANTPINNDDLIVAKEMIIEASFKALSLPTYPQLANFHQMVAMLDAAAPQNRFIALYNGVPSIYEHSNLSHYPGLFPLEYDPAQGKIIFPGKIVEGNQDSEFYPLNERIDRAFARANQVYPGIPTWIKNQREDLGKHLSAVSSAEVVPLPPKDVEPQYKKIVSLLDPKGTLLNPLTVREPQDYPLVDLYLGKEDPKIKIRGLINITPDLQIEFGLSPEGYLFTLPSETDQLSIENEERISIALTAKIHEEVISANSLRRAMEVELHEMKTATKVGDTSDQEVDEIDKALVEFTNSLAEIKQRFEFYAGNQLRRWVGRGFVVLATDNPFIDCLDLFRTEAEKKGMAPEELLINFLDDISGRIGRPVTKIYVGRPVDETEMSEDQSPAPPMTPTEIERTIAEYKRDPKDWVLPTLRIYGDSKYKPTPAMVKRAQEFHWNPLSFYVLERSGKTFLQPRKIVSTFVSPRKKMARSGKVFQG